MCGRYALYGPYELGDPRIVEGWVEHIRNPLAGIARYNLAPSQSLPVLRLHEGVPRIEPMRWGLLPHWAKDTKVGYTTINARIEGLVDKPAFRDAWKRGQRCLVPATGWYEWRELGRSRHPASRGTSPSMDVGPKRKQPYFFHSAANLNPMMFAGLWSRWRNPDDGMPIDSYAILTGAALGVVGEIHDRQPHVLPPDRWATWLEATVPQALDLLEPEPLPVRYHAVGTAVGNVRNDDARLVEPVVAEVVAAEPGAQEAWDFCAGDGDSKRQ
jgi:putative SOS response-associated peptidase YedK